ncbi:MAG: TolC family outer membrane protein [Halothiobacillaceae bacterium]|nr:MAG: TolC family outer membrane protein [Halothiobacillaceae bacterium]
MYNSPPTLLIPILMRLPRRLLALLLLWTWSICAVASTGLLDVLELAKMHDPELASAEAARRAGQEALPQARAALLPQLNASAGVNRTHRELESTSSTTQNYTNTSGALSLRQVLYDRQKFSTLDQAEARVAQAGLQWAKAEQDVALRAAEAYFNLLFAEDSVRLAQAKMAAITEQKTQAEQMYKGGVGTITDIQEAQARFDLAVAEELAAQNQLRNQRQALFKLTGRRLESVAPIIAPLPLNAPEPNALEPWLNAAREGALEVLLADKGREVAQFDVERARSQHLPVLEAVASTQWQGNTDLGYEQDHLSSMGLQVSIPLLAGGRVTSLTRETLARLDQALAETRLAQAESEQRAAEAFHGVNDSIARVRALEQAVRSSEVALDAARIGLDVGYRTSVDVLNAQQQMFNARRDLQQQRYTFIMQRLQLKAAVGALRMEDVAAVDQWTHKNP